MKIVVAITGASGAIYARQCLELLLQNKEVERVASGSAKWDAMLVVPASMGTVARMATGVSQTLIERAADVMLKERRRVVVVVREAPYSLIHLRNMTALTEAGAIVFPASPSFYFGTTTIEELCMELSRRIVGMAGVEVDHRQWGE